MSLTLTMAEALTIGGLLVNLGSLIFAFNRLQVANERRFTTLETQMTFLLSRSHNSRTSDHPQPEQ